MSADAYQLVQLPNGTYSVRSAGYAETMHPGLGPAAEAELLYVGQLKLPERLRNHAGEFVVWDVGLGAAANALALLRATRLLPAPITIHSFDHSAEPLRFALANKASLGYLHDYETPLAELIQLHQAEFQDGPRTVRWQLHLTDFPKLLATPAVASLPKPHAILYDPFSPARNPEMWTLPLFTDLFRQLDPSRPCSLATYSRSTLIRVALLLAGFFIGRGQPSGRKEETTVAANILALLEHPLDRAWLERIRKSGSAEPLTENVYRQAPLSDQTWQQLQAHPQFGS